MKTLAAVLVAAAAAAPSPPAATPPDVVFRVRCGGGQCVVEQQFLLDLVETHNLQLEEIRRLQALAERRCLGERNS
jgi:hypothetical protein